jgi:hypothetical protein
LLQREAELAAEIDDLRREHAAQIAELSGSPNIINEDHHHLAAVTTTTQDNDDHHH